MRCETQALLWGMTMNYNVKETTLDPDKMQEMLNDKIERKRAEKRGSRVMCAHQRQHRAGIISDGVCPDCGGDLIRESAGWWADMLYKNFGKGRPDHLRMRCADCQLVHYDDFYWE